LLVLTYHRVLPEHDALLPSEPTAATFGDDLAMLAECCTVVPLSEALARLRARELPRAAVSITFDDGYQNNYSVALPILQRFGMAATFFVATGYIDRGLMWNDRIIEAVRRFAGDRLDLRALGLGEYALRSDERRVAALGDLLSRLKYLPPAERAANVAAIAAQVDHGQPVRLMMDEREIAALRRAGMEIGAHTVSHPILARLPSTEAEREIADSKRDLERIIGERVDVFAYPNGKPGSDYTREHRDIVDRAGFTAAVTTAPGCVSDSTDLLQLPRIALWRTTKLRMQRHLLRSYLGA
jgi:peptidoglycan/xylan/chitin deacetylase (PgdA/CDA1 family)